MYYFIPEEAPRLDEYFWTRLLTRRSERSLFPVAWKLQGHWLAALAHAVVLSNTGDNKHPVVKCLLLKIFEVHLNTLNIAL